MDKLKSARDKLERKKINENDPIIQQADSLGDIIYLSYGSYVLMGLDPENIVEAIHSYNMHKLFPDGLPHRDIKTNKVLKPENWFKDYQPEPQIKKIIDHQLEN